MLQKSEKKEVREGGTSWPAAGEPTLNGNNGDPVRGSEHGREIYMINSRADNGPKAMYILLY